VLDGDVAGLDGPDRIQYTPDAQQVGDGGGVVPRERLPEVADIARGRDAAGGWGELAGDEAQQGGFAGAVAADEAGATGGERSGEARESGLAVRPGEGDVGKNDGRGQ